MQPIQAGRRTQVERALELELARKNIAADGQRGRLDSLQFGLAQAQRVGAVGSAAADFNHAVTRLAFQGHTATVSCRDRLRRTAQIHLVGRQVNGGSGIQAAAAAHVQAACGSRRQDAVGLAQHQHIVDGQLATGFQAQLPDAALGRQVGQVDRRADGDIASCRAADMDRSHGNPIELGIIKPQQAARHIAQVDRAAVGQRRNGQRRMAGRAAKVDAAGKGHAVGLQRDALVMGAAADQLVAGAGQMNIAAGKIGLDAEIAVPHIDHAGAGNGGAGEFDCAIVAAQGAVQYHVRPQASRRTAGGVIGRQHDLAALGGDIGVDGDHLAGLRLEANAVVDHIDGAVDIDAVRRLQRHIALRGGNHCGADHRRAAGRCIGKLIDVAGAAAAGAGHDIDIVRVKQPVAALALHCAGIDADAVDRQVVARGFHQSAIAGKRAAARRNTAGHARRFVTPYDHLAAIAVPDGVRGNAGAGRHGHLARIGDVGVAPLVVATQQHRAAAGSAAGLNAGVALHGHLFALHRHRTALAGRTVDTGNAARFEQRLAAAGLEHDPAVFAHHRAIGVECATLPDQCAQHADLAALRNHLAHIEGLVARG